MDLSQYSDEDLMRAAGQGQQKNIADYSDEELMAAAGIKPAGEQKGFIDRVADNYSRRTGQMENIAEQKVAGDISGLEASARMGLKYAQLLPDTVGEGLTSAFRALPDAVEQPIRQGASNVYTAVANTPAGHTLRIAKDLAVPAYNNFKENHPVAAGRIGSVLDVGNLAAGFIPVKGKSAINAIGDTTTEAAKLTGKVAGKVGSVALPSVNEGLVDVAASARKFDIPLSFDQISDSRALKNVQKVSQELPFSGHSGFREKQMRSWNRAIFKTVGTDADMFTPKSMATAFDKVGGEFDALTKGKNFNIGGTFINDLAKLEEEIPSLYGKEAAEVFQREAGKILKDFPQGDVIPGDVIAFHRSRLNGLARKASPSIAPALRDLENAVVDGITGGDAAAQAALTQAKHRYKNLIAIEPLAAKAKGGNISPSQLNTRVARIYGRAHTIGESGDIGELARIGNELLPELGGSDTTQKLMYAAGTGTLAAGAAAANLPATAATLTANRIGQRALNRNQSLVNAAVMKEIMKLPPPQAKAALAKLKANP